MVIWGCLVHVAPTGLMKQQNLEYALMDWLAWFYFNIWGQKTSYQWLKSLPFFFFTLTRHRMHELFYCWLWKSRKCLVSGQKMMRFGWWGYVAHSVFKRTCSSHVCIVAGERREGGRRGQRPRETERDWDWLVCLTQKVKCQGAGQGVTCSSGLRDARPSAAFSFMSIVRDRSQGCCVSTLYFYLSFIDSDHSKVVSLPQ